MKKPENIEEHIKQQLDESLTSLPDSVQQKLALARQKALLAAKQASHNTVSTGANVHSIGSKTRQWHKPVWAMAASLCVLVPLWYASDKTQPVNETLVSVETSSPFVEQRSNLSGLDIMWTMAELDEEEMELLDNLEFAMWLSEQQDIAHG